MNKFIFDRSEKVIVWVNRSIIIDAESFEDAKVIAEQQYPDDENVEWNGNCDVLWETEEVLAIEVKKDGEENMDVPIISFE